MPGFLLPVLMEIEPVNHRTDDRRLEPQQLAQGMTGKLEGKGLCVLKVLQEVLP